MPFAFYTPGQPENVAKVRVFRSKQFAPESGLF